MDWPERYSAALEVGLSEEEVDAILDLARDVAHGVLRPAAPLSAYLLGVAVGRGADPAAAAATVTALIPPTPPQDS